MPLQKLSKLECFTKAEEYGAEALRHAELLVRGLKMWTENQKDIRHQATFATDGSDIRQKDIARMKSLVDLITKEIAPDLVMAINFRDLAYRGGGLVDIAAPAPKS